MPYRLATPQKHTHYDKYSSTRQTEFHIIFKYISQKKNALAHHF